MCKDLTGKILRWLVAVALIGVLFFAVAPALAQKVFGNPVTGQIAGFVLVTLPVTLYFALLESSPRQATWGKRKRHLRVARSEGGRMSLGRSLARSGLKFLPWELAHFCVWRFWLEPEQASSLILNSVLLLVWALVGANIICLLASPTRQALYDRLASTVVVFEASAE